MPQGQEPEGPRKTRIALRFVLKEIKPSTANLFLLTLKVSVKRKEGNERPINFDHRSTDSIGRMLQPRNPAPAHGFGVREMC